jgi:hypothetical protein
MITPITATVPDRRSHRELFIDASLAGILAWLDHLHRQLLEAPPATELPRLEVGVLQTVRCEAIARPFGRLS